VKSAVDLSNPTLRYHRAIPVMHMALFFCFQRVILSTENVRTQSTFPMILSPQSAALTVDVLTLTRMRQDMRSPPSPCRKAFTRNVTATRPLWPALGHEALLEGHGWLSAPRVATGEDQERSTKLSASSWPRNRLSKWPSWPSCDVYRGNTSIKQVALGIEQPPGMHEFPLCVNPEPG
jgi:hypothetical protein